MLSKTEDDSFSTCIALMMNPVLLSAEACGAMAANDLLSTLLVVAESKGRSKLAGHLDMAGDLARLALYSFAGERLLNHGWEGWVGLIPVLIVSNFTTRFTTAWAAKHVSKEDIANPLVMTHRKKKRGREFAAAQEEYKRRLDAEDL